MSAVEIRLLNGDTHAIEGGVEDAEKKLSDAARSGQSRLAWFTELGSGRSIGLNPAHVASVKVDDASS